MQQLWLGGIPAGARPGAPSFNAEHRSGLAENRVLIFLRGFIVSTSEPAPDTNSEGAGGAQTYGNGVVPGDMRRR